MSEQLIISSECHSVSSLYYYYYDIWRIEGDPRVSNLPLMSGGPWIVLTLTAFYLYFVKVLGPQLMKDRAPFELRGVIRYYNIFMAILNGWGLFSAFLIIRIKTDILDCKAVNRFDTSDREERLILLGWIFIISRLIEFTDTVFFVLRKSYRQISVLHVFHHSSVPIIVWFGLKFAPGSNNCFFPLINTFVHIIMYSYYALSTFGPKIRPYLWWKKYLTQLQLAQFVIVIIYSLRVLFMPYCSFPKVFLYLSLFMALVFLILFTSFYIKNYIKTIQFSAIKNFKRVDYRG